MAAHVGPPPGGGGAGTHAVLFFFPTQLPSERVTHCEHWGAAGWRELLPALCSLLSNCLAPADIMEGNPPRPPTYSYGKIVLLTVDFFWGSGQIWSRLTPDFRECGTWLGAAGCGRAGGGGSGRTERSAFGETEEGFFLFFFCRSAGISGLFQEKVALKSQKFPSDLVEKNMEKRRKKRP